MFLGFFSGMELQKIIPLLNVQESSAIAVTILTEPIISEKNGNPGILDFLSVEL